MILENVIQDDYYGCWYFKGKENAMNGVYWYYKQYNIFSEELLNEKNAITRYLKHHLQWCQFTYMHFKKIPIVSIFKFLT